jgi:CRISPR-associated protein Csy1
MTQQMTEFFNDRKAAWLKAKLTSNQDDNQQAQLHQEANTRFNLAAWLPDAAKRAVQLAMVSHPSKFSHPSAKTSNMIATAQPRNDGYMRTGNVSYEMDVFGNAAAMDVYKFLMLLMSDGRTVLAHFESDSPQIKALLVQAQIDYESVKQGLLCIKQEDGAQSKTDRLVKQVYFPVSPLGDNYHLLSVLTPSGLLTKVKATIDEMRFSEATKEAKEARRKSESHATGFDDVLDLTVTGFGGTQPQNVSVLNSKNAGRAYLFASTPPELTRRDIRLPKTNFFNETLKSRPLNDSFQALHKLMQLDINNIDIRQGIANCIQFVIDYVLGQALKVREQGLAWSDTDYYRTLPLAQRIWLDDMHVHQRSAQDEWLNEISRDCAVWILRSYEYSLKNQSIKLSSYEAQHVENEVFNALKNDEELFR